MCYYYKLKFILFPVLPFNWKKQQPKLVNLTVHLKLIQSKAIRLFKNDNIKEKYRLECITFWPNKEV